MLFNYVKLIDLYYTNWKYIVQLINVLVCTLSDQKTFVILSREMSFKIVSHGFYLVFVFNIIYKSKYISWYMYSPFATNIDSTHFLVLLVSAKLIQK